MVGFFCACQLKKYTAGIYITVIHRGRGNRLSTNTWWDSGPGSLRWNELLLGFSSSFKYLCRDCATMLKITEKKGNAGV